MFGAKLGQFDGHARMPDMSNDQKKSDVPATILVSPFAPNQRVIVGPFTNEETTTYEVSPLKITISKTVKASHAAMGNEGTGAPLSKEATPDPVTTFMEHLAQHPEVVQILLEKLHEMKASSVD